MSKSRLPSFVILSLIVGGLPLASPSETSASVGDSSVTRLSLNAGGEIIGGDSRRPSYSSQAVASGGTDKQKQWVAFDTSSATAVSTDSASIALTGFSADINGKRDVVIRDRNANGAPTRIVSVDLQSGQRLADSWSASVNSDGRFVAFLSNGTFGDGNGEGNERPCDDPSPDESAAGQGNEARDLNGALTDVYVRDRDADSKQNIAGSVNVYDQKFLPGQLAGTLPYCGTKTALVSVGSDELQANRPNGYKSVQDGSLGITDDGRFVVFATTAQVVTTDSAGTVRSVDNDALLDVYVRDRDTDGDGKFDERDTASTYLISQATTNTVSAGYPTISSDGRLIAYEDGSNIRVVRLSVANGRPTVTNVGTPFAGSRPAIGVAAGATSGAIAYQRSAVVYTQTISIPATGPSSIGSEIGFGEGTLPQLDRAGKTVAFSRVVAGGTQSVRAGSAAVGGSRLVSRTATSVNGNGASGAQSIFPEVAVLDDAASNSALIGLSSDATNLINGDTNNLRDVFEGRWTPGLLGVSTDATPRVPAARGIRLTDVPATALTFDKGLLATVVGAPAGAVRSLPAGGVRSLPAGGVRSLPGGAVRSLQLRGLPLGGIRSLPGGGLRSLPSGTVRSLDVTLSQLALNVTIANASYSWSELLVGSPYEGWPLQSVAMRDLLIYIGDLNDILPANRTAVQTMLLSLTLFEIDPQGVFLQGVSLVSIFLGDYTLGELSAVASSAIDWCATLPSTLAAGVGAALCAPTSTLFALDLGGADLAQVNLDLIDVSRLTPKVDGALKALVDTYGAIPAGTGLATYLMTFLDARDFPWENVALTLPGTLSGAYPQNPAVKRATLEPHARGGLATWVSNINSSGIAPVVVTFTLPAGFAYVAGSAGCGAGCSPTVTTRTTNEIAQVTVAFSAVAGANLVTVGGRPTPLLLGPGNPAVALGSINGQPVGGAARVQVTYDGEAMYDSSTIPNAVAPVAVFDPWGSGKPSLEPGTLYFADLAGASEEDEYTIALPADTPAGTKLSVRLSSLTSDLDLTVFVSDPDAPKSLPGGAIRSLPTGAVRSLPGGAVRSLPAGAIRSLNGYVRSLPLEDVGDDQTSSLPPEVLQDIPQSLPGGYVRALSPNRDNRPEIIDTVVGAGTGSSPLLYTVRVTGYNDSTGPYVLHVITDPPVSPSPAQCNAIGDAATLSIGILPADTTTLILYPRAAIAAKYPADAAALSAKVTALAAFETTQGRPASIAEVTYNSGFDWTIDEPCSVARANAVATSISDELIELGLPSGTSVPPLQYVVIIGGDDVLPMARVADTTEISNEVDYANSFGRSNPLARSAAAGRVLTDNIYGDFNPGTIGDSALLVPELAVGRLVETPAQIGDQIGAFIGSRGLLDAGTETVAAYDFLLDSGAAIASNLGESDTSLINDTWGSPDLLAALGANPKVVSLNAHFDHQGLLTAAGDGGLTLGGFPDQVGLNDISSLNTALVFSVGCHSGLNVPQTYNTAGGTLRFRDWADELSTKSALFVANTGFGYGDTEAIALSEQLMTSFSGLIGTYTAGQALVAAKQEYAASLGSYVGYDEKVVHQSTMYGLPMYSLDLGGAASAQSGLLRTSSLAATPAQVQGNPDVVDSTTSAGSANLDLQTASVVVTTGGTDANGYPISPAVTAPVANGLNPDRQVSNGYPIVPRLQVDVTADGDLVARGALITSMTATLPQSADPIYARSTVDLASREPANEADDVFFPTVFQTVNHVGGPGGGRDRLVLLPGQYRQGEGDANGTMTSFTSMQTSVFYGPADEVGLDLTPPTIDSVVADKVEPPLDVPGNKAIVFRVTTSDLESGVWKVVVLYDLGGNWVPIELTQLVGPANEWVGSLQTNEVDGPRFIVQVVNNDGRVGTATDKGRFYKVTGTRPTLVTVIRGQLGDNGWYVHGPTGVGSPVLAEIYGASGATFSSTVTRNGSAPVGPVTYAGPVPLKDAANIQDGLFLVRARSTSGASLDTNVKVDTTAPTVSATVDGAALSTDINLPTEVIAFTAGLVALSCSDATSGIASSALTVFPGTVGTDSCSGNGTLNTGAPKGLRTITAKATDVAGNEVTTSFYATIKDTGLPIVTITPQALTRVEATGGAGALVNVNVTVTGTDAIDGPLTVVCTKLDGTVVRPDGTQQQFALGVTDVTCSATDSSGNTGSGTFTVTVGDRTAPAVGVPATVTAEATSAAGAPVAFTATASDAVTPNLVPTCSPASGSTFAIGTTVVSCSATDGAGNTGTARFEVKVVDTVKPVLTLTPAGNIVQEASGPSGAVVTYTVAASDTVSGTLTPTCIPPSGTTFALGTTTVSCSATDSAGNTSSITFDVIVRDGTAPAFGAMPTPVVEAVGPSGAIVTYAVTATDVVDPTVTVSCSPASDGLFAVGTTTVNCTAIDDANNQSSGSFTVTVRDTIAPVLSVPGNISAEASTAAGAVVTFAPTASDRVTAAPVITCTPSSGSTFALGTTTVRCTAVDGSGNRSAEQSFSVTVRDTVAPALTVPSNITIGATSGAGSVVTFVATATDAVTAAPTVTCTPPSGSTFPIGTTTVTCTATDGAGNTSASQSFTVTVARPYRYSGFYSPVNMDEVTKPLGSDGIATVVNSVNGGRNVPLKFEVFENGVEITDVRRIEILKTNLGGADAVGCAGKKVIPLSSNTSKAVLKFDGSQLSEGWATLKVTGSQCWKVAVRVKTPLPGDSGPGITAFFLVTP